MIWNYVETAGLLSLHVSLHTVFWNLVVPVITSSEITGGYRELQISHQLEHGPRYDNCLLSRMRAPTCMYCCWAVLAGTR